MARAENSVCLAHKVSSIRYDFYYLYALRHWNIFLNFGFGHNLKYFLINSVYFLKEGIMIII